MRSRDIGLRLMRVFEWEGGEREKSEIEVRSFRRPWGRPPPRLLRRPVVAGSPPRSAAGGRDSPNEVSFIGSR